MLRTFFNRLDRTIGFVEEWSLLLTVSVALLSAFANVFLRKFTSINLYWSDEVVRKVIFFSTYIGCCAAIRNRALIRIDALPQLFPVLRKPLNFFSHCAVLLFAGLMVYLGSSMTYGVFHDQYARTATLQIPEWIFYAVLPLMGLMMFLRTLMVMVDDWRGYGAEQEG
ncbi:MAG: TRAP transporter small permease [Desulfuromonas sp.]|nr:MAG: TRAP transporter small permease [Desulfuromonas sp.]